MKVLYLQPKIDLKKQVKQKLQDQEDLALAAKAIGGKVTKQGEVVLEREVALALAALLKHLEEQNNNT